MHKALSEWYDLCGIVNDSPTIAARMIQFHGKISKKPSKIISDIDEGRCNRYKETISAIMDLRMSDFNALRMAVSGSLFWEDE